MTLNRVLIIGYGNPLRRDDAAGLAVVDLLEPRKLPGVTVHRCQQLTPDVAELMSGFGRVFFIDSSLSLPPGHVDWQEVQPLDAMPPALGHHLTPPAVLAICTALYSSSPVATLIAIGAADLGVGPQLSAPVSKAVVQVANDLANRLAKALSQEPEDSHA